MIKPKVRIFTSPICPYCFALREFLKDQRIVFEEIDVSKDELAREEMIKKTGRMEVPIIEIDDQIVVGFDKEKISHLLGIPE